MEKIVYPRSSIAKLNNNNNGDCKTCHRVCSSACILCTVYKIIPIMEVGGETMSLNLHTIDWPETSQVERNFSVVTFQSYFS